jgi:hypothetical protein
MQGPGSFRRFKAALATRPEHLRRWRAFRQEQIRAAILHWFHARGMTPVPLEHASPDASAEPPSRRAADSARQQLYSAADGLSPRDLQALMSLAEYLRAARSALRIPADSSMEDAARAFGLVP